SVIGSSWRQVEVSQLHLSQPIRWPPNHTRAGANFHHVQGRYRPFVKTDTGEYRAMNPTGLVPTLQEDEFTLWESNAILRYLCTAHVPDSQLWRREVHARANVDRWMDAQQTTMNRPQAVVFQGLIRTPADKRDHAAIARAVDEAARAWSMLGTELASIHTCAATP
ncbi:MAG: glutathione S-transferase family protein, partial [Pseudomonadota bacterium]|nr:glutathione S-transferase family protein [Pseudomonadota bacterium]